MAASIWLPKGQKGDPGDKGPQGDKGPDGDPGLAATWLAGPGAPAGLLGDLGDMYLNSTNGDVYGPKTEAGWGAVTINIRDNNPGIPDAPSDGKQYVRKDEVWTELVIPTPPANILFGAQSAREALAYGSSTSVKFYSPEVTMGGFRFRGKMKKSKGRILPLPATNRAIVAGTGLGAETAVRTENWYAGFAVANAVDTAALIKSMPFLRVGSISGSVVTLQKGGERVTSVTAQTYAWSTANNLAGVDCLVISEAAAWSGRVTTITANAAGTVTLADVGTLAAGDFILPAPPGYTEYSYLGSFYYDTAEVRNIYDTGSQVKAKMTTLATPALTGSVSGSAGFCDFKGYIPPLATGVITDISITLGTSGTGEYAAYISPDAGGHTVEALYYNKSLTSSVAVVFNGVEVPFLYPQSFYFSNGGGLASTSTNVKVEVTGWYEP